MRFAYGATRFVIITERYAIKIARIRLLRPLTRIVRHLFGDTIKSSLLTYDRKMAIGCATYLIPGIVANRAEARLYRKYRSDQLAPTLFTFFWLVNVQRVGTPVSADYVEQSPFFAALRHDPKFEDVLQPWQYCVIDGRPCLADYGRMDLDPVLAAFAAP